MFYYSGSLEKLRCPGSLYEVSPQTPHLPTPSLCRASQKPPQFPLGTQCQVSELGRYGASILHSWGVQILLSPASPSA